MSIDEAQEIMRDGMYKAKIFSNICQDSPINSPLHKEMKQAIQEALSWTGNEDVVKALRKAWQEEDERYDE